MKKSWRSRLFAVGLCISGIFPMPLMAAPSVTPLQFGVAIERGDTWQAKDWLDAGLDPNYVGDRIGTGLMIGAWEGNLAMVQLFHSRGGRIDFINKHGEQALQLAAFKGHIDVVRWLLAQGAPINRDGKEWSALHYAVFNGHRDIARLLIQRGADVNARVPNDATALMLAAREGRENLADDLIKAGADPRLTNDRGETAMNWAMLHGNPAIAKMVSTPEAFANAVRSQPVNQAPPMRSVEAPSQIEDLLRRIRYAESQNLPTAGLRKALMTAVERTRLESKRIEQEKQRKDATVVKSIVITAQRKGGGEKADIVYGNAPATQAPAAPVAVVPLQATKNTDAHDQRIQLLLARIRVAKANGEPTDQLRKELMDAVTGFKP